MIVAFFPSMKIQASQTNWDFTVTYYLDYYKMKPVVEIRLANNDIQKDSLFDYTVGVINGSELEQLYEKQNDRLRYNCTRKVELDNFKGDSRYLSVIVYTEDKEDPIKQITFEIYNFPQKDKVITLNQYTFSYISEIKADYNAQTLEVSYEHIDFGALLEIDSLFSESIVDFEKWSFKYYTEGRVGTKNFDSAQVCFSEGFNGDISLYDDNKGYCFTLDYKNKGNLYSGFMLRSTYYDEENDIYYKENVDGKLKEVSELQLSSETKSTYVTLEIFGQGVNKINYQYNFIYINNSKPKPPTFEIGDSCSTSRYCIYQTNEPLDLLNYKSYKVGDLK